MPSVLRPFNKIYTIRILKTDDPRKWYHSKEGRTFDAFLINDDKYYFKIDEIHKIPSEFTEVVSVRQEMKYYKL